MAGIDKTYAGSYEEYKEYRDWANAQVITFFDGHTEWVRNYVYHHWNEENFSRVHKLPIMSTSNWLDAYLIQNCPMQFVIDRMKYAYDSVTYDRLKNYDLSAPPPENFKQNRKILIKRNGDSLFQIHETPIRGYNWRLCGMGYEYNRDTNRLVHDSFLYPTDTDTVYRSSLKAIIRFLRTQYLESGAEFELSGRYVGEVYSVHVH